MRDVCSDAEMLGLLRRAQEDDPAAYDRLYNLYADKIFRYLYARLGQREVAEDLTADVFVRMLQTLPRFRVNRERPVASFSAWLYRIAANLLTDYRRRQSHRSHEDLDAQHRLADGRPDPYQYGLAADKRHILMTALGQLAEEQRVVVIQRFAEGYSVAEIAEAMGKSIGAVKALQHRAIENLRRLLSAEAFR